MSKYAEKNVDKTSKNILGFVFAPLIIIALISGIGVWLVNVDKKARKEGMEAACAQAMQKYYNAFKDEKTVYKARAHDITFLGDSDKYFRGSGFKYKLRVNRAESNKGRTVYGRAYVKIKLKIDGPFNYRPATAYLEEFVVLGDY